MTSSRVALLLFITAFIQYGCRSREARIPTHEPPVKATRLALLLPELKGYTLQKSRSVDTSSDGLKWSLSQGVYTKASSVLTLTLFDFDHQPSLDNYARFLHGYQARSDEGYTLSEETAGLPGWITWEPDDKEGTVGVAVNDRFYVVAMSNKIGSLDSLKSVVRQIDLAAIAKLGS